MNLVKALETAHSAGALITGIVGKDGGFTKQLSKACVVIPNLANDRVTPHQEGLCAVIWHLLVSHPSLKVNATKW